MEPTIGAGDWIIVEELSYRLREPRRGELVVFRADLGHTNATDGEFVIKRVVGLPGEEIAASNGTVLINGREIDEPYLTMSRPTPDFSTPRIPARSVFLMGDNRRKSDDSRVFGPIEINSILGKVIFTTP
jgi:signal peptidase I